MPTAAWFPAEFQGFEICPSVSSLVPLRNERLLTLRHQQQRACNLAEWMLARGAPARVLVVGGGLAGLTFAAAYKKLLPAAELRVVERLPFAMANLRACRTRWLHPHLFAWPERGWQMPSTMLPVMNWSAGVAHEVYGTLSRAFDRTGIPVDVWTVVTRIARDGDELAVATRSGDAAEIERRFDSVVLAVGPGLERLHSGSMNESYWHDDLLDREDPYAPSERHFVVAGGGDGALTDLFRLCLRRFVDHASIADLIDRISLQEDDFWERVLGTDPLSPEDEQTLRGYFGDVRTAIRVTLVTDALDANPFRNAFRINRIVARALERIGAFRRQSGRTVGAASWVDPDRIDAPRVCERVVVLEDHQAISAHGFVARVGVTPPTLLGRSEQRTDVERAILGWEEGAWRLVDEAALRASEVRARPVVRRTPARSDGAASPTRVFVRWHSPRSVEIAETEIRFDDDGVTVVSTANERFDDVVLQSGAGLVGLLPRIEPPDAPGGSRLASMLECGVRLFVTAEVEGREATLRAWKTAGATFQIVELTPTAAELGADQPVNVEGTEPLPSPELSVVA